MAQRFGLALAKPGRYITACGKGYFDCKPGEPQSVDLKGVGFRFFVYESAATLYFWESGMSSFKGVQISD